MMRSVLGFAVGPRTSFARWGIAREAQKIPTAGNHSLPFIAASNSYSDAPGEAPSTFPLDPLVVCGPSGAGKGTIIHRYMTERGGAQHFAFGVSHTTRSPRQGEIHGLHYHFVNVDEMQTLLSHNAFLESAEVHGNWYGTSWRALNDIQAQGKRGLLDLDVQGVRRIQHLSGRIRDGVETEQSEHLPHPSSLIFPPSSLSSDGSPFPPLNPRFVFVAPPSLRSLEDRLVGRGSESPETLVRRLANARAELEFGLAPGNFDAIVVNDDLDRAVLDFEEAVRRLYELE